MAKILLVDDHPDIREITGELLQMHGHAVVFAENAEDAWKQIGEEIPEAMIVDQRLPGMSGLDLLRRIRGDSGFKSLPVIIYSAEESRRDEAINAGATEFWLKGSDGLFNGVAALRDRLDQIRVG